MHAYFVMYMIPISKPKWMNEKAAADHTLDMHMPSRLPAMSYRVVLQA
jgi:hypothetical protein